VDVKSEAPDTDEANVDDSNSSSTELKIGFISFNSS
jgi:hypothetical protein